MWDFPISTQYNVNRDLQVLAPFYKVKITQGSILMEFGLKMLFYKMSPIRGIPLKGLFFLVRGPDLSGLFFLPLPSQVPIKGGGWPNRIAAPAIRIEEPPVSFLTASMKRGIPMLAKIVPIPFPTCFPVTLKFISLII